jgi:GDSL-like Lipase/Acylhydrolase family
MQTFCNIAKVHFHQVTSHQERQMPLIRSNQKVSETKLHDKSTPWRKMIRCDVGGGDLALDTINQYNSDHYPEKLIYAEGDSWFDKFTPIPNPRTNLLQEIRLPFRSVVVDVSTIGDESGDMVKGQQAFKTRFLFKEYGFNAILLSAGGNDLKNLYAYKIDQYITGGMSQAEIAQLSRPSEYQSYFDGVIENIKKFIKYRDDAGNAITRAAPIFVHGYDYIQPRNAKARVFSGSSFGLGPWLYPVLKSVGFTDSQMRSAADAVVDQLNNMLATVIAPLDNVYVIDSRGLLTPAAAGSNNETAHWLDEIHPSSAGFEKLAACCWNKPLAEHLGYAFQPGDLMHSGEFTNESTALA